MRSFDDADGQCWQAALMETSYGDVLLVFSPLLGGEHRQQALPSRNLIDAVAELAGWSDTELRALLAESQPWDAQAGVDRAQAAYGGDARAVASLSITRVKYG